MNVNLLSMVVLILHWVIVAGLLVRVIMRRIHIGVSMAWIAVITSTPFVGAGFYLLFGEKRLGRRRSVRVATCRDGVELWQKTVSLNYDAGDIKLSENARAVYKQAKNVLGFPAFFACL